MSLNTIKNGENRLNLDEIWLNTPDVNSGKPFFLATSLWHVQKVQKMDQYLGKCLQINSDISRYLANHSLRPAPESLLQVLSHLQLDTPIKKIVRKEARSTYAPEIYKYYLKTAIDAHLDAFHIGFGSANNRRNNMLIRIVESVLTALALKGALFDKLERYNEIWAQSLSVIDLFAGRALTSKRLVCPVGKSIREGEQFSKVEETKRTAEVTFFLFRFTQPSSKTSTEFGQQRHW